MRLSQSFYNQNTLKVAQNLLGKFLVRQIGSKTIVGQIVETEAYRGPNDLASHASRGKTPRTELMFGQPGFWYIYLIYGMYYCLNIITEKNNYPAAVLIRAVNLISPVGATPARNASHSEAGGSRSRLAIKKIKTDGPGKLCRAFKIDKTLNGAPAFYPGSATSTSRPRLWIEDRGVKIKPAQIKKAPRVGVDYAGEYKDKLWRFYVT